MPGCWEFCNRTAKSHPRDARLFFFSLPDTSLLLRTAAVAIFREQSPGKILHGCNKREGLGYEGSSQSHILRSLYRSGSLAQLQNRSVLEGSPSPLNWKRVWIMNPNHRRDKCLTTVQRVKMNACPQISFPRVTRFRIHAFRRGFGTPVLYEAILEYFESSYT